MYVHYAKCKNISAASSSSYMSGKRQVTANAYRFIYGDRDCYSQQLKKNGAFAVNSLVLQLNEPAYNEVDVGKFLDAFSKAVPLYMNLKELHIEAPYAALKGNMIRDTMSMDSCFTVLHIRSWTFHSASEDQWKSDNIQLENLQIHLGDGITFPSAFKDILLGLSSHQPGLKQFHLKNGSPHNIVVNRSSIPPRTFIHSDGVVIAEQKQQYFNMLF